MARRTIEVTAGTYQELKQKADVEVDDGDLVLVKEFEMRQMESDSPKCCPRCRSFDLRYSKMGIDCHTCGLAFTEEVIGVQMDRRRVIPR